MEALKVDSNIKNQVISCKGTKAGPSPAGFFYRRIGGTLFKVRVYTGSGYADTLDKKISRLICSEMMTKGGNCGMMDSPQMSQPPERSST